MSWIDECLEKRNRLMRRNNAVANGAEGIFNDLWTEITTFIVEARAKGLKVQTNGSSFERIVWTSAYPLTRHPPPEDQRELKITLSREDEKISACETDRTSEFSIDVCDDAVVCLKRDGKRVLIQEAARLILEPFLFPELQPKNNG